MTYVVVPKEIGIREIANRCHSFSPHALKGVFIPNKNTKKLGDIIGENYTKGKPISRSAFTEDSAKFLVTNSALQNDFLLSRKRGSSFISLVPSFFGKPFLMQDSILLAMNGNVGQSSYVDIDDAQNYTISPWMINFRLEKKQNYLLAFLKSKFFEDQVEFLTPKGAILSNANKKLLDAEIAFPNGNNSKQTIEYVEILVQSIINKEKEIIRKSSLIFELIDKEISENQQDKKFHYNHPRVDDLTKFNRINAGFYSQYFKEREFQLLNYSCGTNDIRNLGFDISRGQNLQVSCIGKSIYSEDKVEGFYTLIIPKNISVYGTPLKYGYLGSSKKLKTLKAGDIIFGAEGFEKGRSLVIFEDQDNTITNIHGITLNHSKRDVALSVFVKCFLDYLRQIGLIDLYAVGGNGGSLAQKYWDVIPFPNFPDTKQKEIVNLYYKLVPQKNITRAGDYFEYDRNWNNNAGIFQIDESLKKTKEHLEFVINKIISDKNVEIDFSFLG
jgi:type I restriction enzyme S subunit